MLPFGLEYYRADAVREELSRIYPEVRGFSSGWGHGTRAERLDRAGIVPANRVGVLSFFALLLVHWSRFIVGSFRGIGLQQPRRSA